VTAKNVSCAATAAVVKRTDVRAKSATRTVAASAAIKNVITEVAYAATKPDVTVKSVRTAVNATRVATTVAGAIYPAAEAIGVEIAANVLHATSVIAVLLRTRAATVQIRDVEERIAITAEIATSAIKTALAHHVSARVHVDLIVPEIVIALIRSAHAENVIVRVAVYRQTAEHSGFRITVTEVQVDL